MGAKTSRFDSTLDTLTSQTSWFDPSLAKLTSKTSCLDPIFSVEKADTVATHTFTPAIMTAEDKRSRGGNSIII